MARYLGETVHYVPHPDYHRLGTDELAGLVTRIHPNGTADLVVFPPDGEPVNLTNVPPGDTHHTHRSIALVMSAEPADGRG